jgi:UDP-N-acetylmuramoylalanine--D-glutamate ligase
MIPASTFAGKTVAVLGLGASGVATARALMAGGAAVLAADDGEAGRAAAERAGLSVTDLRSADWTRIAALVLAPGVPLTHPEPHWTVALARAAGVEVIGDFELFLRERARHATASPLIAITGTNGKSTTTALAAHLLRTLGHDVAMGGNIGVPILELEPASACRIHVIELSSFQIDLAPSLNGPSGATVGVLLNLSPDHIDRHGTMASYAAIKERLVQGAEAAAIGGDDADSRAIAERIEPQSRLYGFTAGRGSGMMPRLYAIGTSLFVLERSGITAASTEIASTAGIGSLRGQHNVQNALAALAALRALQDRLDAHGQPLKVWQPTRLQAGLASFPGLPHRMEEVGRIGDILFINDSKATNADSTEKALAAFPGNIHWIVGGKAKEGGIAALAVHFPRIARAYLIGDATESFAATLDGKTSYERSGTLEIAIASAAAEARKSGPGAIVLLSPACASYDQFRNFEHRGAEFRRLATSLAGFTARGAR